ncbi:MAG: hypothetical protein A2Y07_00310 [Planctomycetes bacterium GWF2_50_10]|nr:MAG: hypothetical protein A2Y07_00310 [Planctomycetes bacterium GWF2_50_10]
MKIVTIFAAFLLSQAICLADVNEPNTNNFANQSFRRGNFRSESATINWHDGIQHMVVSPRVVRDNNSIWIFPLKCKSDQVKFNLTGDTLRLSGMDPREIAQNKLKSVNYALIATQLWTLPICYFNMEKSTGNFSGQMSSPVDSNGVRIELFQADSVQTLAQQLESKGRIVPLSELEPYAAYLNSDYSLLTVWREGNEPNMMGLTRGNEPNSTRSSNYRSFRRRPSIYVEFPSDAPYYVLPQKPGRQGRVSLTIAGFWQIANRPQAADFRCNQFVVPDDNIPAFFASSQPLKNIPITTISLGNHAGPVTDLSFVPGRLENMACVDGVANMSPLALVPLGIISLALISYVSAGVSGLLIYKKWRGFATLGFFNIFTILAVGAAMNYRKTDVTDVIKSNKWKARIFLAVFSVLVALISLAAFAMLTKSF